MSITLKAKTTSSIRWTALNAVSVTIIQFTQLAILGRLLNPKAFGLMAMLMVVIEIARVFSQFGLSEAIISKQDTSSRQLSSLYWINVLAGLVFYAALVPASPAIADFFNEPELAEMLPVIGFIFIISAFCLQFESLLRKNLFFDALAKINILTAVLSLIVAVGLALYGLGVWSLIFGQLTLHTSKSMALFSIAIKKKWLPDFCFRFDEIKGHVYFGLNRVGAMMANQVHSRADQMVIGSLLGPVALGFYSIAYRIVLQPIQRINPILTQVAFPVFSVIQEDNVRLKRGFVKMIHLLMSINAPLLIGFCAIAPLAVPLLLGDRWIPAIHIVQVLAFYALLRTLGNASGSLVMAKGKASWEFYWNLALLVLIPACVLLAFVIKKSVLLIGVVLVIMQVLLVVTHYLVCLRKMIGHFAKDYALAICKPLFSALIMGIIVYHVQMYLDEIHISPWVNLIISILVGMIIYITISLIIQKSLFKEFWNIVPTSTQNKIIRISSTFHYKLIYNKSVERK